MTSESGIRERYEDLRARIERVASRAGRSPDAITLVAVTKTIPAERIREAHGLGIRDFGENRVQEFLGKSAALGDLPIRWHLIGHLQTNKVRQVLSSVALIHSVDSRRLAEAIDSRAPDDAAIEILMQVNTSGETSKFGCAPEAAPALAEAICALPGLRLRGLMTVGPLTDDPDAIRASFRRLRELGPRIRERAPDANWLSMGMTGDFEIAIEEGTTHLRVGSALFGTRD